LDTKTEKVQKLNLVNFPRPDEGLWLHGFDLWVQDDQDPSSRAILFAINHRLPFEKDHHRSHEVGARSVIEVFETTLGSKDLVWLKTIEDSTINTPNNMIALGPNEFYVSNDHAKKVTWKRKLDGFYNEPTSLTYCDISDSRPQCKLAITEIIYPNGITKGPGSTIWVASSVGMKVKQLDIQADHSLVQLDEIPLRRVMDNINVDEKGEAYIAVISCIPIWQKHTAPNGHHTPSPTEVWKVFNNTEADSYYGKKYKVEKVFSDDGQKVSGTTNAVYYNHKLYMTGLVSNHVSICDVPF